MALGNTPGSDALEFHPATATTPDGRTVAELEAAAISGVIAHRNGGTPEGVTAEDIEAAQEWDDEDTEAKRIASAARLHRDVKAPSDADIQRSNIAGALKLAVKVRARNAGGSDLEQ